MGSSLQQWIWQKLSENDTGLANGATAGSYLKYVYLEHEVPQHSHNEATFYRDNFFPIRWFSVHDIRNGPQDRPMLHPHFAYIYPHSQKLIKIQRPTVFAKTEQAILVKVWQCEYQFDTAQATHGTQSVLTCRNFVPETICTGTAKAREVLSLNDKTCQYEGVFPMS